LLVANAGPDLSSAASMSLGYGVMGTSESVARSKTNWWAKVSSARRTVSAYPGGTFLDMPCEGPDNKLKKREKKEEEKKGRRKRNELKKKLKNEEGRKEEKEEKEKKKKKKRKYKRIKEEEEKMMKKKNEKGRKEMIRR
jgi:hypothetical protein